jgi:beta-N-acetylhexosaminidase
MKIKKYRTGYRAILLLCTLCVIFLFSFLFSSCKNEVTDRTDIEILPEDEAHSATERNNPPLEEMIGQMIIVGFRGTEFDTSSKVIQDINEYNIGGVVLFDYDVPSKSFPRNILDRQQLETLIKDLKELTRSDLFIAVDAEGGYVNRLKEEYGFEDIKSAQEMGEGSPEDTFVEASRLGEELASLGININFAPVVDVNINKDNPVIGKIERSFSDDPQEVYEHAGSFIDAMHRYNIIAAIKHFPGHGSSSEDSHLGLTDITLTYNEETELLPYKKLIEDGRADIIMTAHIMNTDIDPDSPATLSPIFLEDILRDGLSYDGVIVSDDMQMGAITSQFGFGEAIIKAVNAGCNLLIFSNNGSEYDEDIARKAAGVIKEAVDEGKITETQITVSYNRIIELKDKYRI